MSDQWIHDVLNATAASGCILMGAPGKPTSKIWHMSCWVWGDFAESITKIMKIIRIVLTLSAGLAAINANAQRLTMTEQSSTVLIASYTAVNGDQIPLNVNNTGADQWNFEITPDNWTFAFLPSANFAEPENSGQANVVTLTQPEPNFPIYKVTIQSDTTPRAGNIEADGIAFPFLANQGFFYMTYYDSAATSEATAPDATSTASLLLISATALTCLIRRRISC